MISVDTPRHPQRADGDFTLGCGQPPAGVTSGRVCARTGTQLSCKVCPDSPTYYDNPNSPHYYKPPTSDPGVTLPDQAAGVAPTA